MVTHLCDRGTPPPTRLNGRMHDDSDAASALRTALLGAGYTVAGLRELWGDAAADALDRADPAPARRQLARHAGSPLAALARLFYFAEPVAVEGLVPVDEPAGNGAPFAAGADPALKAAFAAAQALGLVRVDPDPKTGDVARPLAVIRPYRFTDAHGDGEWLIASDPDELAGVSPLRDDHVLGVGGAGRTLAGLLGEAPVASALDLGCGCGILALHLSRSAARVVATDISERALAFTRLNAGLNGVTGIETRLGSLFEPVAGDRFDRIAANPPFVITPRADDVPRYEYRDAGLEGDALMAVVVEGVGARLTPGGTATLLGNWEYRADAGGLDRVRGWIDSSAAPLDAWVIERERLDPARYAGVWVRDGGTRPGSVEYDALVGAWLDDFDERDVTGIGLGWVALRRPHGEATLARYEEVGSPVGNASGIVVGAFEAHDRLEAQGDATLAASVLLVAPDVTEARHHVPGEEGPRVIELRQGGALGRTLEVDPALAAVVGASDGDLGVGVLIDAVAQLLEVDAVALRADLLPRIRELVFTGFLTLTPARDFTDAPSLGV